MALISAADQQHLRESFAAMTRPVRLLFFTQTLGCETCLQTRQILDELPPLSDRVAVEEVNLILEPEELAGAGPSLAEDADLLGEDERAKCGTRESGFLGRREDRVRVAHPGGAARRRPRLDAVARKPVAHRRRGLADHGTRVHDADLPALPARRDAGARDGVRRAERDGHRGRGYRISRSGAALHGHGRPENGRQRNG